EGWQGALKAAGIKTYKTVEWTPEFVLDCLKVIVKKYPYLTPKMTFASYSDEIGDLLYETYGIKASGKTYYNYLNTQVGGFEKAFQKIKYQSPWPKGGLPSKEHYIEILQYIQSQGI